MMLIQDLRMAQGRLQRQAVLILEAAVDIQNITTVLRTAECLGLQNVWIILPRNGSKRKSGDPLSAQDGIVATTGNLASAASCSNASPRQLLLRVKKVRAVLSARHAARTCR